MQSTWPSDLPKARGLYTRRPGKTTPLGWSFFFFFQICSKVVFETFFGGTFFWGKAHQKSLGSIFLGGTRFYWRPYFFKHPKRPPTSWGLIHPNLFVSPKLVDFF